MCSNVWPQQVIACQKVAVIEETETLGLTDTVCFILLFSSANSNSSVFVVLQKQKTHSFQVRPPSIPDLLLC
jgi:hypothetical protein